MLRKSRAVVLRVIKYSDATLIVDTYTETEGRRSFALRIPKTRKASVKPAIFVPMALLQIEWDDHGGASRLVRIRAARPDVVYSSIPYSPAKAAIAMFLAEFLTATLREAGSDGELFDFIGSSLLWLDAAQANCANFHVVFLLRLSRFLGLQPNLESFARGRYFDMQGGTFVSLRPASPMALPPDEARLLPRLMRLGYDAAARLHVSRAARARALQAIIQYYSLHIPAFPRLKSPEILGEVFG